ncbi:MAG TPA: type II toxin-antitoxin system VapC family toxin [Thermoanaerobaculia bacterium]|nr:type II toxin-antitoxin system VapC family toxin [Thermoanaerobaculia bacterium]
MAADPVVVDASIVVHAIVPGQRQEACMAQLGRLIEAGRLAAPSLWLYEVTSSLSKLAHFGDLTDEEAERALADSQDLGVELFVPDLEGQKSALAWAQQLGRAAAYDGFYLSLARRLGCDLWTTDLRLVRATDLPWVRAVRGLPTDG